MVGISTSTDAKKTCSIETGNIETWNRQAQQGRQLHSFLVRSTRTLKDLVWPNHVSRSEIVAQNGFSWRWFCESRKLWSNTWARIVSTYICHPNSKSKPYAPIRSYNARTRRKTQRALGGRGEVHRVIPGIQGTSATSDIRQKQCTLHCFVAQQGGRIPVTKPKKQNKLSAYTRSGSCVKTFGPGQTRLAAAQVRTGTRAPTRCDLVALRRRRSRNLSSPAPFSGCSVRAGRGCPAPRPY